MEPRYVTTKQVSQITNVSGRTIKRLIASGELPSIKIGRLRRIRVAELERWLDSQSIQSTADTPAR